MTAARRDWSRLEVEAVVADYLEMFRKELVGESYSKTEHRRRLLPLLDGRSEGSIEYKHQNISAALIDLGQPYIDGYKPQRNYQELLLEVVADRLAKHEFLLRMVQQEVERQASPLSVDDILDRMVATPSGEDYSWPGYARDRAIRPASPRNHLLQEARNASLGSAGEQFVLNYECARLLYAGHDALAGKVEHVAVTRGDHEGYDVLSFELDGRERLIEVKTTAFGQMTPFFVSRHQVQVSEKEEERYSVYRVFRFRKDPKFFALNGAIGRSCALEPSEFQARPGWPAEATSPN